MHLKSLNCRLPKELLYYSEMDPAGTRVVRTQIRNLRGLHTTTIAVLLNLFRRSDILVSHDGFPQHSADMSQEYLFHLRAKRGSKLTWFLQESVPPNVD